MSDGTLIPGAIGRLTASASNAAATVRIPGYIASTGKLATFTPDQIANGANAVDGPSSSTDNAIARFDLTTGKLLQNSAATIADTTGALTIPGTTNQFVLGTTNTTTISSTAPAASRTVTIPDALTNSNVLLSEGAQTINGIQTFGAINNSKATNAITAFATGGQSSAVALTSDFNTITVCATAADSVKLPTAVAGMRIVVANAGAAYASVFPISGDAIDSLAVNTSVSLPTGSSLTFICTVAGTWKSSPVFIMPAKYTTGTTTTTFAAGQCTGAAHVVYANTQATPGSIAFRTASEMFIDNPSARVGLSYLLTISNAQGTGTLTVTGGAAGITLTGTATIAINTSRTFVVTYTSASALVIQNVNINTFS